LSCLLQLKFVQVFLTYVFFFRHACLAMTSIVDSRAHFLKRCSDMGMTDRAINHLVQGMLTMGKVAFSVGSRGIHWTIQSSIRFAQNTLGALINQANTAVLKRLVFEGNTLVLGQLRELVTDSNAAASRKLPAVEGNTQCLSSQRRCDGAPSLSHPMSCLKL